MTPTEVGMAKMDVQIDFELGWQQPMVMLRDAYVALLVTSGISLMFYLSIGRESMMLIRGILMQETEM